MKLHSPVLSNGLQTQILEVPSTEVVTTMILVRAGSRYEDDTNPGLSHFLEHMFFKGGKVFTTPQSVNEAIDGFGGEFNAFTGKEYAGYYVKSNRKNLEKSLAVLSDMLIDPSFPAEEIEKERGVILQEMAMYQDAPMYQISWDFEQLAFGDQPLGRDQIGTEDFIKSVQREDFVNHKERYYTTGNMIVVLAGGVKEGDLELLEQYFGSVSKGAKMEPTPFDPEMATEREKKTIKKSEQVHVSIGVPALSEVDERYPVLRVLRVILGGNMSSRMFNEIREKRGLCYSVRSQVDEYTDAGLFTTVAGVSPDKKEETKDAIKEQYKKIAQEGITEEELTKAKNYILGKSDLFWDDTENMAHEYGKNWILYQAVHTPQEGQAKVLAVTKEQVDTLAQELFDDEEEYRICSIGPV